MTPLAHEALSRMETLAPMEKRWQVFQGTKDLGLMTAKEIREALRQGTLDPFDKVSRQGSNIREDLIEVDEIFKESLESESIPQRLAVGSEPNPLESMLGHHSRDLETMEPTPLNPGWRRDSHGRSPAESEAQQQEAARAASNKQYYVLNGKKVLGPLSALEIQSLFNRGMLNKKVKVQKHGSDKTFSITQFVASYSGDRLKELAEDGKIPQQIGVGSPSSKVLNELARMANSQRLARSRRDNLYILLALFGLAVGVLAYFSLERSSPRPSKRSSGLEDSSPPPQAPAPAPSRPSRPRLVQKTPEARPADPGATGAGSAKEAKSQIRGQEEAKQPAPVPRQSRPERTPRAPEPKANAPARGIERQPPARPRPTEQVRRPAPAPVARPALGPIARAKQTVGRIQTIGPLSFNPSALEACATKCNLTLRDSTGATLKAVFFKNSYYDQLKPRSRSVFITGSTKLERGELTVIIQDLR